MKTFLTRVCPPRRGRRQESENEGIYYGQKNNTGRDISELSYPQHTLSRRGQMDHARALHSGAEWHDALQRPLSRHPGHIPEDAYRHPEDIGGRRPHIQNALSRSPAQRWNIPSPSALRASFRTLTRSSVGRLRTLTPFWRTGKAVPGDHFLRNKCLTRKELK